MKKLVLFVSVLALGLTSCSKDDDGGQASLEGTWEYSKDGEIVNGVEILSSWEHTEGCTKDYTVITSNMLTDHYFYMDGTTCDEESYAAAYTRNGDTVTLTLGAETHTATILQLDDSTLKISNTDTFEGQTTNYITVYTRR